MRARGVLSSAVVCSNLLIAVGGIGAVSYGASGYDVRAGWICGGLLCVLFVAFDWWLDRGDRKPTQ